MRMGGTDGLLVAIAVWAARTLSGLAVALIVWILVLRARHYRRQARVDRLRAVWEPLLAEAIEEVPGELPAVDPADTFHFLLLWSYVQESVLDVASARLNALASGVGMGGLSLQLLRDGSTQERLVALTALGHLRDYRGWDEIERVTLSDDVVLSLCAARALLRIDAYRAANTLMPLIVQRTDWPSALIASMLEEAGPDVVSVPVTTAIATAPADALPRMVRFLELVHTDVAAPVVRQLIATSADANVLAACLRAFADPEHLDVVRRLLEDPRAPVRLNAAVTLGRLGTDVDRGPLTRALGDAEWWVRYRAARALASLPTVDTADLHDIADHHPDRYARDMVAQVIAEEELAC